MIRKYHNHKLQTDPWHHKEEPHNNHESPGRQTKQSNQGPLTRTQGDGAKLLFSIELVVFQGVSDSLYPSGFAHCLGARVYVCGLLKSPKTKHAVSSSKA